MKFKVEILEIGRLNSFHHFKFTIEKVKLSQEKSISSFRGKWTILGCPELTTEYLRTFIYVCNPAADLESKPSIYFY